MRDPPPWLSEGNAEALSLHLLAKAGLLTRERVRERVRDAVGRCLLTTTTAKWSQFMAELRAGRRPYDCGLLLHMAAAAPSGQTLDHYWVTAFNTEKVQPDGANFSFLSEGAEQAAPIEALTLAFAKLGVRTSAPSAEDQSRFGLPVLQRAFVGLMQQDCQGGYGVMFRGGSLKVDRNPQCAHMSELEVIAIEGSPISQAWGAAMALNDACLARGRVRLDLGPEGGASREVPCKPVWQGSLRVLADQDVNTLVERLILPPR